MSNSRTTRTLVAFFVFTTVLSTALVLVACNATATPQNGPDTVTITASPETPGEPTQITLSANDNLVLVALSVLTGTLRTDETLILVPASQLPNEALSADLSGVAISSTLAIVPIGSVEVFPEYTLALVSKETAEAATANDSTADIVPDDSLILDPSAPFFVTIGDPAVEPMTITYPLDEDSTIPAHIPDFVSGNSDSRREVNVDFEFPPYTEATNPRGDIIDVCLGTGGRKPHCPVCCWCLLSPYCAIAEDTMTIEPIQLYLTPTP